MVEEQEFPAHDAIRKKPDEFYFQIEEINSEFFETSPSNSMVSSNQVEMKLPKVTVPTFDGSMLEWSTFFACFHQLFITMHH